MLVALNAELDTGIAMNLMLGDCLERMKEIPDGSVDLTVTSPPYDNLEPIIISLDWLASIFGSLFYKNWFRVTKKGGVVVWIVSDATIKGSETGTSFRQALYAKDWFRSRFTILWAENNPPTDPRIGRYTSAIFFEYMFIFSKKSQFIIYKERPAKWLGRL